MPSVALAPGEGGPVGVEGVLAERTVAEVEALERTLAGDMERKKEELRTLVARRYRDLITASEAINSMRQHSHKIVEDMRGVWSGLERLAGLQQKLVWAQQRAGLGQGAGAGAVESAAELSALLAAVELSWEAAEEASPRLVDAVHLLLLAESLHHRVRHTLAEEQGERRRLLELEWGRVRALRHCLTRQSQELLVSCERGDEAEPLASLALLQGLRLPHSLHAFLDARQAGVEQWLGEASREGLCAALGSVEGAVLAVARLFGPSARLRHRLDHLTTRSALPRHRFLLSPDQLHTQDPFSEAFRVSMALERGRVGAALGRDVWEFRPSLPGSLDDLSQEELRPHVAQWLAGYSSASLRHGRDRAWCWRMWERVGRGAEEALGLVEEVGAVGGLSASLRAALPASLPPSAEWGQACEALLGDASLSVWEQALRKPAERRIQTLADSAIRAAFARLTDVCLRSRPPLSSRTARRDLQRVAAAPSDVVSSRSRWLYTELASDEAGEAGTLRLKARGLTLVSRPLLQELEGSLGAVASAVEEWAGGWAEEVGPGSQAALRDSLRTAASDALHQFVRTATDGAQQLRQLSTSHPSPPQKGRASTAVGVGVWRWETVAGAVEECGGLRALLSLETEGGRRAGTEAPHWATAKHRLAEAAAALLRPWAEEAAARAVAESGYARLSGAADSDQHALWLADALVSPTSQLCPPSLSALSRSAVGSLEEWEWLGVGEEEEGSLAVPAEASRALHRALRSAARAVADLAPHRLPSSQTSSTFFPSNIDNSDSDIGCVLNMGKWVCRETLSLLMGELASGLGKEFGRLGAEALEQAQAFQLLFDARLLGSLLGPLGPSESAALGSAVAGLEGKVDPFDLDLAGAALKRGVAAAAARHVALYGPVLLPETAAAIARRTPASTPSHKVSLSSTVPHSPLSSSVPSPPQSPLLHSLPEPPLELP